MNMIEDDAGEAFEVAYAGDLDAAGAAVAGIIDRPQHEVDKAARLWMDRCLNTAGLAMDTSVNLHVDIVSDHSGTGLPEPMHQVPVDVRWAGTLFAAYLQDDGDARMRLWERVPGGQLHRYMLRLLTTMAFTVRAYHEDGDAADPLEPCCGDGIHAWLYANPQRVLAAAAKAHLN